MYFVNEDFLWEHMVLLHLFLQEFFGQSFVIDQLF